MIKVFTKLNQPRTIWGLIIVFASIFYLTGITHESLWCDEAFSAIMTDYGFIDIIKRTAADVHPPLYYLFLKLFRIVLGNSEWALRLLSVFSAAGMIALGAGPVRRLFGDRTAYIYAITALFTPIILIMGHEVRMYAPVMFTVTASALYALSIVKENKLHYWVIFGLLVEASAYLHYYGLLSVFFMNLFLLLYIIAKKRSLFKRFVITAGIVFLSYLPWFLVLLNQAKMVDKAFWIPTVTLKAVFETLMQPFYYKEFYPVNAQLYILAPILLMLVFGIIIYSFADMVKKRENEKLLMSVFLFSVYVCTFLAAIVISLIVAPVFYRRYIIVCTGVLLLPFCIGIGRVGIPKLRALLISLFALLNTYTVFNVYTHKFNGLFYEMRDSYKESIKPGDLIITSECHTTSTAIYYFPKSDHFFSINPYENSWSFIYDALRPKFVAETDLKAALNKYKAFWYIQGSSVISVDPYEVIAENRGWEQVVSPVKFSDPYSNIAFTVSKFAYTGKASADNAGKIKLHISGIRKKDSYLWISLYTKENYKIGDVLHAFKTDFVKVTGSEMDHVFNNVKYGDYVIMIIHDENNNSKWDIEQKEGSLPKEGVSFTNYKPSIGIDLTFDNLKFPFHSAEKTMELPMGYPPDFLGVVK